MNEQLFNEAAQIRIDELHRSHVQSTGLQLASLETGPRTRHVVAFAAAVLVNLAVLGTLQWTASNARYTPAGEVVITELQIPAPQLAKN